MKKFLLYSLVFTMAFISCSKDDDDNDSSNSTGDTTPTELTITSDDFGDVGDIYYRSVDSTDISNNSVDAVDGIWDFKNLSEDKPDTVDFRDPNGLPSADQFPDANVAFKTGDGYIYAIKSDAQIDMIGMYMISNGQEMTIPFDDYLTIYKFPIKDGSSFSDEGSGQTEVTYNGFPLTIKFTFNINAEIQGKGEMKLAADSATCLKEKRTMITTIDLGLLGQQVDTSISYNFYAKGKGFTYVEVALDSLGNNKSITFLK